MTFNEKTGKQMYEALKGVVRVADRKTVEFDAAHAAIAAAEANPKVTREFVVNQIDRLAGMKKFPAKKLAVLKDMIESVMAHNPDEGIVKGVIDTYARESSGDEYCPSAGDLQRAIGEAMTTKFGALDYDVWCKRCGGDGWVKGTNTRCDCLARRKDKYKPPEWWLKEREMEKVGK